jgi:hypothetical protein
MAQNFQNSRSKLKHPGATRMTRSKMHTADVANAPGRAGVRDLGTCEFCGVFDVNVIWGRGKTINQLRICGNFITTSILLRFCRKK